VDRLTGPALDVTAFRLTHPFRIEAVESSLPAPEPGWLLLRPLRLGVCGSDLKLYTGARERSALMQKLPLALLHEGVAEVVATGPGTGFEPGQHVVPSPNVPCTIAHPDRYPDEERACYACRPGGAGANYCMDGEFLSSNVDGMARTAFLHPAACTIAIPDGASDAVAVLAEPLATVLAGLEHAAAAPDGRFLVIGNGTIGLLTLIALRGQWGVGPDRITVTGRHWDARADAVDGLATTVDDDATDSIADLRGRIDVAFECVGGDSNAGTLALAIDMLRPGGTGIMFGPSEGPLQFDTRKMIAKGLNIVGCNRALTRHFADALCLAARPEIATLLERALAPKEFTVRGASDLDDAMYYAWTKTDAGRAVTLW
jgi:ribitol-5-phosphate 2-dehydrogenase (NADP+)